MAELSEVSFGRRYAPDDRDKNYPMRLMLDPLREQFFPKGLPDGYRHYVPGQRRNQKATGTCVAFGVTLRVESAPIMQPLPKGLSPYELYRQIVTVDEWSDNDHEANAPDSELQSGSSIRAGLKIGQRLGCFPNYLWAESVDDVRAWHLAGFGGVVIGITWTTGMMQTDAEGFLNAKGRSIGGHCVTSIGWNDRKQHNGRITRAMRIQNSWALPWGENGEGRAWISVDDLAKALDDHGEFGAPTEVRVAKT